MDCVVFFTPAQFVTSFTAQRDYPTRSNFKKEGFILPHSLRDKIHPGVTGMVAGSEATVLWNPQVGSRERTSSQVRLSNLKACPSYALPPVRLYRLRVSRLSQTVPPPSEHQAFQHMSLQGAFQIQTRAYGYMVYTEKKILLVRISR